MGIILHVGHGKTGSSAIQSFLALNQELLENCGIYYADHPSLKNAKLGKISSGNLGGIAEWQEHILRASRSDFMNLYSGERLFNRLQGGDSIDLLKSRFRNVRIVLFVRDPFDHVASSWLQMVKGGGYRHSLEVYALNEYKVLRKVLRFFERYSSCGVDLRVKNYSKTRSSTLKHFVEMCAESNSEYIMENAVVPKRPVNRSLTRSECRLQIAFNRVFGESSSRFISVPLVNELREMRSDVPFMSIQACTAFSAQNRDIVDEINEYLPEADRLSLDWEGYVSTELEDSKFYFSEEQIDVLVDSISKRMGELETRS